MGLKAKQFYTICKDAEGVILWDTTLSKLCIQFNAYDAEARGYDTIVKKLREENTFTFKTQSNVQYIVQKLERD